MVDRTAPPPVSVFGPQAVSVGTAFGVSWSGQEAGARATWSVVTRVGAEPQATTVVGPVAADAPRADIAGLPAGAYAVRVTQTDPAGNAGPAAYLAVNVVATAAPAPNPAVVVTPPAPTPPATPAQLTPPPAPSARTVVLRLPALRAARLQPRRAAVVRKVRPMLRWTRGPAGTTIYNVQIFRVGTPDAARANAVPLRKIRSAFPRARQLRAPRLVRGACYVWRVWPYRGATFTTKPLAVSHFCVARRARAR